jgi:hypothetical protein
VRTCCANRHIRGNNENLRIFFIRLASPLNRVKIAVLIVMVQHEGHERIGEVWKQFRTLCLLALKLPFNFTELTRTEICSIQGVRLFYEKKKCLAPRSQANRQ